MNLVSKGRTLVCEIADFDACDKYLFHVTKADSTLEVEWKLKGCGDHGTLRLGGPSLKGATKLMGFSQGNVSRWQASVTEDSGTCKEGCDCHTLPLLLGRAALAALEAGEAVELNVFGAVDTFEKKGTAKREVEVDGKKTKVSCVHAAGEGGDLWVLDDVTWPVILRVETDGGENYCELVLVSAGSIKETEANLESED